MLPTLLLSHPDCQQHEMGQSHPESPQRLAVIQDLFSKTWWQDQKRLGEVVHRQASALDITRIDPRIHPSHYLQHLKSSVPAEGYSLLDEDTKMNPYSLTASLIAAGSGVEAVEQVLTNKIANAFCIVRPPGHHAESDKAMGFCMLNSIAIAAEKALSMGLSRVAIVDFDVHHGNGTVEIFQHRPEVLVCSSFQHPYYPNRYDNVLEKHIILQPLVAGTHGAHYRQAIEKRWTNAMHQHQPELILVSAGFDAHTLDPLAQLKLQEDDFEWLAQWLSTMAKQYCQGRWIAMLEGGYHLEALASSVDSFLRAMVMSR